MTYTQLVGSLGITLLIIPILGLPGLWKDIIIVLIGLFLVVLAYTRSARRKFHKVYSTKTFTESKVQDDSTPEIN